MTNSEYITKTEAAKLLNISYTTIYRYVKGGKLKEHQLGLKKMLKRSEVLSLIPTS